MGLSRGVFIQREKKSAHLWKKEHTEGQNCGPDELNCNRDAIRGMIGPVFGGVVEDGGEEETNGDSKLVKSNDSPTNPLGGTLGLVHWDQSGNHADAETSPDTTNDEDGNGNCGGLQGDTDGEDKTRQNETPFTTEVISTGSGKQGA
jgi:hypothetical protein